MSEKSSKPQLRLDPWVASSLLQKAIRRGEVDLAQAAARELYRQRGAGVFRRLCVIAVEDIGIADIRLLQEVVGLAIRRRLRVVVGDDGDIIADHVARMAAATKDRSADYLVCAATKLETALAERSELERLSDDEVIAIAVDDEVPLVRRAVAALIACTVPGPTEPVLDTMRVIQFLNAFTMQPQPLKNSVLELARVRSEPFCVVLPLIWSLWSKSACPSETVDDDVPPAKTVGGVPLYAWDKHTALGKRVIARFARENEAVAAVLRRYVRARDRDEATAIAAFYADASPVRRRLQWSTGYQLEEIGREADMTYAGCSPLGVDLVLEVVRRSLGHLDQLRSAELGRRRFDK